MSSPERKLRRKRTIEARKLKRQADRRTSEETERIQRMGLHLPDKREQRKYGRGLSNG
jgi:hypothetical protein